MKKILSCVAVTFVAVCMVSCVTTTKTAKVENISPKLFVATTADLDVANERITYTMIPTAKIRRAGVGNVKRAAIAEALQEAGKNYDLLVEPEFVVEQKRSLFTNKITKITVSGRPAKYTNFHSLGDDVWTNPACRNHEVK